MNKNILQRFEPQTEFSECRDTAKYSVSRIIRNIYQNRICIIDAGIPNHNFIWSRNQSSYASSYLSNHPFYTIPYMYASFDRIDFLNTNDSQILSVRWTTTYPLQMAADMVRLNTFHMKESTSWVTSDRQVYAWICFETETSFTAFLWVSDIEIWIFRFCCGILSMHSSVNVESGSYEKFFIDVIKMTPNINIIFFVFLIEKC